MVGLQSLRLGYVPYSNAFDHPGDRRRFCHYANRRGFPLNIADPNKTYDAVIVSEGGDLSVWSQYQKGKVIFDMVNANLDVPRTEMKGLMRGLAKFVSGQHHRLTFNYWRTIQEMCRNSEAVVCGSPEQADRIRPFQSNVHAILDHHGMYDHVKEDFTPSDPFRLVWEGLPHNAAFFSEIKDVLVSLHHRHGLSLHVITTPLSKRFLSKYGSVRVESLLPPLPFPVFVYPWDERTVSSIITSCDLALIPIPMKSAFNSLKPENKLLIFWRMGMPVVTSAIPSYVRVMREAGVSQVCRNLSEWESTLERCISDFSTRCETSDRGKKYVATHCREDHWLTKWDAVFSSMGLEL
ncbi:MAG: hypothetical protein JNK54_03695 [Elusimicrobia bacterium]|jgi:hypothetical protein|nr:hypothetical protein [Elusimicrobiota bacterium]